MPKTQFKNGKWAFIKTGKEYYARLRGDGVWLYIGDRPSHAGYCGVIPLDRFLTEYRKVKVVAD